jgi:hypothetical protein
MYCYKCENICNGYTIEEWKKQILLQMDNFKSKLTNKIKGLNCIIEITMNVNDDYDYTSFVKQLDDIIDTMFVDISHIDNFSQLINNLPISNIIKRKNTILNNNKNNIIIPSEINNKYIKKYY